jgi:hypothetical protein
MRLIDRRPLGVEHLSMRKATQDLSMLDCGWVQRERRHGSVPIVDPGMHQALTDLHTYVLVLDAEWQRLGESVERRDDFGAESLKSVEVARRRAEMTEELQALRATTAALREIADSAGRSV